MAGKSYNICNIFDSLARIKEEAAENLLVSTLDPSIDKATDVHLGDLVRLSESTKSAIVRSSNTSINSKTNKDKSKFHIVSGANQSLKYDIFDYSGSTVFCIARTEPSFVDATSMINDCYVRRHDDLIIPEELLNLKPIGIDICAWYH